MPPEVNAPTILINGPNGILNVVNPLYNYTFHPQPSNAEFPSNVGSNGGKPVSSYHSTVRYPNVAGQSQPDRANLQLQANSAALRTLTYQLITEQSQYGPFSNMGFSDDRGGRYNSIENMHNAIHMMVGNGGHMSNIPYSSFDPIFWLHHANVDRLFALWQAVYPNATVTPQVNAAGSFTEDPGTTEDINTQIVDWGVDSSQLTTNVKARLNALYNPSGSTLQRATSTSASNSLQLSPNSTNAQWLANIRVQVSSMTSPFFVHLFLGDPPADPATWSFAPNLIGSHSVLDTSRLSAAKPDIPITLFGQVPLNPALLVAGNSDLAPKNVVPLLTSQLNWRLQNTDDSPLDIGRVSSLKIHVVGQAVKARVTEEAFPEYGEMQTYKEITAGKAGGLGVNDVPE
ncbi:MAG: hypothetical protein LQ344_004402 [Seirophora lacunosa]|nr:MAG: hypothetical protein LQ344_004402 [Seirophora lacunosa]